MVALFRAICFGCGISLLISAGMLTYARQDEAKSRYLVYSTRLNQNSEIFRMSPDGSNKRNISQHPANDWSPTISPDGRSIVFASTRDRNAELYSMRSNGTHTTRLTETQAGTWNGRPKFSPDGQWIAYLVIDVENRMTVYAMRRDGSDRRRLSELGYQVNQINWMPDSRAIVYDQNFSGGQMSIYRADLTGDKPQKLTGNIESSIPTVSPDGEWIAFVRDDSNNRPRIHLMRPDGSDVRPLNDSSWVELAPVWSPDGQWIAFASDRGSSFDLFIARPDGSEIRRLAGEIGRGNRDLAVWSPDSQWIAFLAHVATHNADDLYVHIDGDKRRNLTPDSLFDSLPQWDPIIDYAWSNLLLGGIGLALLILAFLSPAFRRHSGS